MHFGGMEVRVCRLYLHKALPKKAKLSQKIVGECSILL